MTTGLPQVRDRPPAPAGGICTWTRRPGRSSTDGRAARSPGRFRQECRRVQNLPKDPGTLRDSGAYALPGAGVPADVRMRANRGRTAARHPASGRSVSFNVTDAASPDASERSRRHAAWRVAGAQPPPKAPDFAPMAQHWLSRPSSTSTADRQGLDRKRLIAAGRGGNRRQAPRIPRHWPRHGRRRVFPRTASRCRLTPCRPRCPGSASAPRAPLRACA